MKTIRSIKEPISTLRVKVPIGYLEGDIIYMNIKEVIIKEVNLR